MPKKNARRACRCEFCRNLRRAGRNLRDLAMWVPPIWWSLTQLVDSTPPMA